MHYNKKEEKYLFPYMFRDILLSLLLLLFFTLFLRFSTLAQWSSSRIIFDKVRFSLNLLDLIIYYFALNERF